MQAYRTDSTIKNEHILMTEQLILRQIELMPPGLQKEVLDFIGYLVAKYNLDQHPGGKRPKFGSAKGKYKMAPDFDAPLEEFNLSALSAFGKCQ